MTIQQTAVKPLHPNYYPTEMPIDHNHLLRRYAEHLLGWRTPQPLSNFRTEARTMERIVIVGSSGSGKSTLARQLGTQLTLPVVHLDRHFWHAGWVGTPYRDWQAKVQSLASGNQWVIDGNYRSTLDIRVAAADTIVFLDLPRSLCIARAIKRRFQYLHKPRPDMAKGCQERLFDPYFHLFLRRIWHYSQRAKPQLLQRLATLEESKTVIHLTSTTAVNQFLAAPQFFPHGIQASVPQPVLRPQ